MSFEDENITISHPVKEKSGPTPLGWFLIFFPAVALLLPVYIHVLYEIVLWSWSLIG